MRRHRDCRVEPSHSTIFKLVLRCNLSLWFISFLAVVNLASLNTTLMTQLSRWEILTAKLRQTQLVSQTFFTERTNLTRKSADAIAVWM
jgi:hypothetical protein